MNENEIPLEGAYTLLSPAEVKAERALIKAESFQREIANLKHSVENVSRVIDFWKKSIKKERGNTSEWFSIGDMPIDESYIIILDSNMSIRLVYFRKQDGFPDHNLSEYDVRYIGWIYFPNPVLIAAERQANRRINKIHDQNNILIEKIHAANQSLKASKEKIKQLRNKLKESK